MISFPLVEERDDSALKYSKGSLRAPEGQIITGFTSVLEVRERFSNLFWLHHLLTSSKHRLGLAPSRHLACNVALCRIPRYQAAKSKALLVTLLLLLLSCAFR